MEQRKGISLITLMITIVILIILAAAVILSISDNNPVENARVASVTQTKDGIESAILAYVSKIKAQTLGKYDTDYIILGKTYDDVSLDEYRIVEKSEEEYSTTTVTKNEEDYTIYKIDKTEFESKIDTLPTPPVKGCDWYVDENGKVYLVFEKKDKIPTWMTNDKGEIDDITLKTFVTYQADKITASVIKENPTLYYGKTVTNYSANGVDSWKVFHADDNNIYLISSDYVLQDSLPSDLKSSQSSNYPCMVKLNTIASLRYTDGTDSISADNPARSWLSFLETNTSSYANMKAVAFLMDTEYWSLYKDSNGKAKWVIGGPTLDLFAASYNNYYKDNTDVSVKSIEFKVDDEGVGYLMYNNSGNTFRASTTLSKTASFYVIANNTNATRMWFASPSASDPTLVNKETDNCQCVDSQYKIKYISTDVYAGIRPIVCLNDSVSLVLNDNDTVTLK